MTHQKITYFLLLSLSIAFLSCGSNSALPPPKGLTTTLFKEDFTSKGSWVLFADPGNQDSYGSHDYASAVITNGFLSLVASQDYGCPDATAKLVITNPMIAPANSTLEIKIAIKNANGAAKGEGIFTFHYGTVSEEITIPDSSNTQTLTRDFTIPASGSTAYDLEFEARACSGDAYSDERFSIDSVTISYY